MSRVQVLVATMHQTDYSLLDKMNIQTDALVGNQCDRNEIRKCTHRGHEVLYFDFKEKGVGLNRNNTLMRATGEICLFADDDMRYLDGYEKTVLDAFDSHPDADVILFNINRVGDPYRRMNEKEQKIGLFNYMNYGAVRIAFRRKVLSYNGIYFNENFGGGTPHLCGEDTLFLNSCYKKKLKIIALPLQIAVLNEDERPSTWFEGYNRQYFFDKGVLLALAHPILASPFALYFTITHKEYAEGGFSKKEIYKTMRRGIGYIKKKEFKKEQE